MFVVVVGAYSRADGNYRETIGMLLESSIEIDWQEFFDSKSLYHKNIRSRRIEKESLAITEVDNLGNKAVDFLLEQFRNGYSALRVQAFVDSLFSNGRTEISSNEIDITGNEDFILLLLAVVRQNEHGMGYKIQLLDEKVNRSAIHGH